MFRLGFGSREGKSLRATVKEREREREGES